MSYKIKFHTRWSDFDANKHMRHTAYNDYAAEARLRFLTENGFSIEVMEKNNIGPVLFSENTLFKREIKLGEDIHVELFLEAASSKGERFKIMQHVYREDGVLAATISVYLAWIDLSKRKLTAPPKEILKTLEFMDKLPNFEEIILR
ncbi:MAG TPA: thioesterase [Flavobacteriaceae bacterium]|nr:thioesterase [Flavobacteriaceae bacterium]